MTEVNVGIVGGVIVAFILFWLAGGFERIDCALKVEKACAIVAGKYPK